METSILNIGELFLHLLQRLKKEIDFSQINNLILVMDVMGQHGKMDLQKAEKQKVFDIFLNSGLHGGCWPNIVYSVISFRLSDNCQRVIAVRNHNKRHSEHNAVDFLRELLILESLPPQTIKWYVNFSPCRNCSDKIDGFITEARTLYGIRLQIDMQFPCLYKIRRPSCERELCSHLQSVSTLDHRRNIEGLRQIQQNGVMLRTIDEGGWSDIREILSVAFSYRGTPRNTEDVRLNKDFHHLMSGNHSTDGFVTLEQLLQEFHQITEKFKSGLLI
ncbi:hypothetical protein V1264_022478 [Littorina saxatilis]|uniref:Uncharacterized protein n=1 Tax=Littorina saxatilis TaxID=31220 RepID=A0AAN9AKJ6_9CAEN